MAQADREQLTFPAARRVRRKVGIRSALRRRQAPRKQPFRDYRTAQQPGTGAPWHGGGLQALRRFGTPQSSPATDPRILQTAAARSARCGSGGQRPAACERMPPPQSCAPALMDCGIKSKSNARPRHRPDPPISVDLEPSARSQVPLSSLVFELRTRGRCAFRYPPRRLAHLATTGPLPSLAPWWHRPRARHRLHAFSLRT